MKHFALVFALCSFGATLTGCGGGGGGGGGGNTTTVDVTPNVAQLQAGGTQQFTANVQHGHGDKSVTWSLSSSGCSGAACGTLSSTAANPVTYTAPTTPPSSNLTVTLTATSVSDPSVSAPATITVVALAVSVAPASASVPVNTAQQFTATVVSDSSNAGVKWTLSQSAIACAPVCGTISAPSSASGAPITYTAPATVPASATVTLTATSAADSTKTASATITVTTTAAACGTGSESLMTGQYSFLVQGFDASGPVAIAGGFIADGTGKITGGVEDINRASGPQTNLVCRIGCN